MAIFELCFSILRFFLLGPSLRIVYGHWVKDFFNGLRNCHFHTVESAVKLLHQPFGGRQRGGAAGTGWRAVRMHGTPKLGRFGSKVWA